MEVFFQGFKDSALRWTLVIALLTGIGTFGFLLFSPIIHVREVQVTRLSPRLDIQEVQEALRPIFNKHLFFLSSFEVSNLLQEGIPDLSTVEVDKIYPSTLHVSIDLHPLAARLNIVNPDDESGARSGTGIHLDFMTEQGIYIETSSARDTQTLPEFTIVDWGVRPDHGSTLISPAFLERMNAAEVTLLRQFGQEVTRRTVYLRAQEYHLQVGTIELWFDFVTPLDEQMLRYKTFLSTTDIKDVRQYIDLRVRGRVTFL